MHVRLIYVRVLIFACSILIILEKYRCPENSTSLRTERKKKKVDLCERCLKIAQRISSSVASSWAPINPLE